MMVGSQMEDSGVRAGCNLCRRQLQANYAETTYDPVRNTVCTVVLFDDEVYADSRGGVLCRNVAVQKCYEETM
jgi:hypothetical protein